MQSVSLNGEWEFKFGSGKKWMKAKVPGDVHLDLLENKVIEDPLYGDNAEKCKWIEEETWIYKKNFFIPKRFKKDRVELIFKGLDLDAEIFFNGIKLEEHHNAFIPCVVNVTEYLEEENNELIVKLDVGKNRVKDKPVKKYYAEEIERSRPVFMDPNRIWMRKPQFVFGWDWAPYLPTCGIWRDVELISYENIAIRNVFLYSYIEEDKAVVNIDIDIENLTSGIISVDLLLSLKGEKEHNLKKTVTLNSGLNKNSYKLEVSNPKLWYPQPVGNPYLYDFSLTVYKGSKELNNYSTRHGIREIELIQEPIEEGESFIISVNKKKVFCKGANWVPVDSIPANVSKEKYGKLIELASKANFNMFRIWGGGIYEDPLFYKLCDEYGIMVWQDFMFACAPYPDDDPEFIEEVKRETHAVINELRNHASLVLWCGNNENQWIHQRGAWGGKRTRLYGSRIYDELLPEMCSVLDPTRPYWPSSPYGGKDPNCEEKGDRHSWETYILSQDLVKRIDYRRYALDEGKFITEYGQLAPSAKETLIQSIPRKELYLNSPVWEYHNNTHKTAKESMKGVLKRFFISEEKLSLKEYVIGSQMLQAEALKFSLEHWRRRMFNTAGALFWMYADCWGTTGGWTIVDYYLRLKPSYFYVKKAFEPLHVSLKETSPIEVWVTSDTYDTYSIDVEYGIKTFDGEELIKEHKQERIPTAGAMLAGKVDSTDISQKQRSKAFCYAKIYSENKLISQNRCFLVDFKNLELPEPNLETMLKKISDNTYQLELNSKNFGWMVSVELPEGGSLSDNYFDIFPGEKHQITITTSRSISIEDIGISTMNQVIRKYKKGIDN